MKIEIKITYNDEALGVRIEDINLNSMRGEIQKAVDELLLADSVIDKIKLPFSNNTISIDVSLQEKLKENANRPQIGNVFTKIVKETRIGSFVVTGLKPDPNEKYMIELVQLIPSRMKIDAPGKIALAKSGQIQPDLVVPLKDMNQFSLYYSV